MIVKPGDGNAGLLVIALARMKRPVFLLLLLSFVASYGQDSQGAYRIGGGVIAPRVIIRKEPDYSEEARAARLEGTVLVSLVVGGDGSPRNISVEKRVGFGLDEKTIEAVSAWRFAPGQKDGSPVPVLTTLEVNFRLAGKAGRWHLTRAVFNPPTGTSDPLLVKQEFPPDAPAQKPGSVSLTFEVDEQGVPINIHVEQSSDADSERDVIAAAREWRFNPGLKNGVPIVVPMTLEFSRIAKAN